MATDKVQRKISHLLSFFTFPFKCADWTRKMEDSILLYLRVEKDGVIHSPLLSKWEIPEVDSFIPIYISKHLLP